MRESQNVGVNSWELSKIDEKHESLEPEAQIQSKTYKKKLVPKCSLVKFKDN